MAETAEALAITDISTATTAEILTGIQQALLPRVVEAPLPFEPPTDSLQYYFAGDNEVARVLRTPARLRVRYASHLPLLQELAGPELIELSVGYGKRDGEWEPMPLWEKGCITFTMNAAAHPKTRHEYCPKPWPDGGYSLERVAGTERLDDPSIVRMTNFANKLAKTKLILARWSDR